MRIILLGPSGSGKGTIGKYLSSKYNYKKAISCTTRKPRLGEVDGVDYHFKKEPGEEYKKAIVKDIHRDAYYWTDKKAYTGSRKIYGELSRKGAKEIKKVFPDTIIIALKILPNKCFGFLSARNGIRYANGRMDNNVKEDSFNDYKESYID